MLRRLGVQILLAFSLLSSSCASSLPVLGTTAAVNPSAEAPPPAAVARVLTEDPFAEVPEAPRMMHHGRYTSPVPGTDIINDEAFPNEDPSQGMGGGRGRATEPPGSEPAQAPDAAHEGHSTESPVPDPSQGMGSTHSGHRMESSEPVQESGAHGMNP